MLSVWNRPRFCHSVKSKTNQQYNTFSALIHLWLRAESFTTHSHLLTTLKKKTFENIVGKRENAGSQHFLFFLQCFLSIPKRISVFKLHLFGHL